MKNGLFTKVYSFLVALVLLACYGCHDRNCDTAHVDFRMTSTLAPYQEVNVDIRDIQINTRSGEHFSAWQSVNTKKGVYNLEKLINGLDTLIGDADLPSGRIAQLRLVLGNRNTVKVDGKIYPLSTPSSQQGGLTIAINLDIKAGNRYVVLLNFDAAQSVIVSGGKYILKPVLIYVKPSETGGITGTFNPVQAVPVYAILGADTVARTTSNANTGVFLMNGLNPGSYRVVFTPASGRTFINDNVAVTAGNVTNMGSIKLP